jgi:hypothetical protein
MLQTLSDTLRFGQRPEAPTFFGEERLPASALHQTSPSTWMTSARRMVDSRWVIISMIMRPWRPSLPYWMRFSFSESKALVASSSISKWVRERVPGPGRAAAAFLRRGARRDLPIPSSGTRAASSKQNHRRPLGHSRGTPTQYALSHIPQGEVLLSLLLWPGALVVPRAAHRGQLTEVLDRHLEMVSARPFDRGVSAPEWYLPNPFLGSRSPGLVCHRNALARLPSSTEPPCGRADPR